MINPAARHTPAIPISPPIATPVNAKSPTPGRAKVTVAVEAAEVGSTSPRGAVALAVAVLVSRSESFAWIVRYTSNDVLHDVEGGLARRLRRSSAMKVRVRLAGLRRSVP